MAKTTISPRQLLAGGSFRLTPEQTSSAVLILEQFALAGLPTRIAMGAVANAMAESQLDPVAVAGFTPWTGRGHIAPRGAEDSAGLFMLNAARGAAGEGMRLSARKNAYINTARIIEVTEGQMGELAKTHTAYTAAAEFCRLVERPANVQAKMAERSRLTDALFGTALSRRDRSALPIIRAGVLAGVSGFVGRVVPLGWWGVGLVGAGMVGVGLTFYSER